jgi:hypothetical protein
MTCGGSLAAVLTPAGRRSPAGPRVPQRTRSPALPIGPAPCAAGHPRGAHRQQQSRHWSAPAKKEGLLSRQDAGLFQQRTSSSIRLPQPRRSPCSTCLPRKRGCQPVLQRLPNLLFLISFGQCRWLLLRELCGGRNVRRLDFGSLDGDCLHWWTFLLGPIEFSGHVDWPLHAHNGTRRLTDDGVGIRP